MHIFQVTQNPDLVNTGEMFSFHPVGVFHALYNMQLSDEYENLLKEMCWNVDYLIIFPKDQYMVD